jgi:hypothetical protein
MKTQLLLRAKEERHLGNGSAAISVICQLVTIKYTRATDAEAEFSCHQGIEQYGRDHAEHVFDRSSSVDRRKDAGIRRRPRAKSISA